VTSMADACERAGLEIPVFSDRLQQELRGFLPSTASGANPVDITFAIDLSGMLRDIPRKVLESGEVDGLIIHGIMGSTFREAFAKQMNGFLDVPLNLMEEVDYELLSELITFPKRYGNPIVCSCFMNREDNCTRFLQDHSVPVLYGPENAVKAMAALARYGEMTKRLEV